VVVVVMVAVVVVLMVMVMVMVLVVAVEAMCEVRDGNQDGSFGFVYGDVKRDGERRAPRGEVGI
jgi:hypothetical protein